MCSSMCRIVFHLPFVMLGAPTCFLSSENGSSKLKQSILHNTHRLTQAIIAWSQRIRVPRLIDYQSHLYYFVCLTERVCVCVPVCVKILPTNKLISFSTVIPLHLLTLLKSTTCPNFSFIINKGSKLCPRHKRQHNSTKAIKILCGKTEPAKTPEILIAALHSLLNVGVHSHNRLVKCYGGHS